MAGGLSEQAMAGISTSYRLAALTSPKRCYHPGCTEIAIASHFIQRNGPLRHITEDDHVVELRDHVSWNVHEYRFKRVPPAKAMTFRGFCSKHDLEIFRQIENPDPDWNSPRSLLLLSYRAYLNEMRKVDKNIDWMKACLDDNRLIGSQHREWWDFAYEVNRFKLREMEDHKKIMEADLAENWRAFAFEAQDLLDGTHVACSATYGGDVVVMGIPPSGGSPEIRRWPPRFVHLIPDGRGKTLAVFGIQHFYGPVMRAELQKARATSHGVEQMLTEILVQRCETWCCKPSWYATHVAPREEQVLAAIKDHLPPERKALPLPFNLFERPLIPAAD